MHSLLRFSITLLALVCAHAHAAPAQRIVTLAPHLAELVYAAGAGAKLVGVSTFSDHPAAAAALPVVASDGKTTIESVLALKPDLVLAWQSGNRAADMAELQRRGIEVVATEATTLADVARLIRLFGTLAGTSPVAEANAQAYERRIAALHDHYADRPSVRVFVEIWHEPLMTVNGTHVVSEALALCGATNLFAEAGPLTPIVSREQLYARRPDAILSAAFLDDAAMHAAWQVLGPLEAVQAGRVYRVDADLLTRMGPRLAEGVGEVCAAVERARGAARR